jgi:phosphate-selective porin OprO/OprP
VLRAVGIKTNALPIIHLEQVKLSGNFGARVEVDGAAFVTTDSLTGFDNGVELRRLLLYARGDCILLLPFSYYLELGLNNDQFTLNKSYLRFPGIDYIGALQIGQFQPPMGLQIITSSRDITFMEPAAPLQAIAPGVEAGLQIGRPVFDERGTWNFGLFAPGAGNIEYGNASENYGSAILRVTALPLWHEDTADPTANRYLHLGVSANILYSGNSTVRYQSRPESFIAPIVIDTDDIDANSAGTFGGEAAWVNGPLSLQGEFIYSRVKQNDAANLSLFGGYGQISWYLTGESRPYDRQTGAFKRLVPRHNFDFGKTGWGAWEIAARFSYTDLTDANVSGGRLSLLMTGVNWYLHPHIRWMFNYGMGRVSDTAQDGDLFIFQTRIGVDF